MLGDFSIADCLALRQLRHFYGTRCSLAKIAIPYTIYLSLNLLVSDAQACFRLTPILSLFARGISFQSAAIFPCLYGTTQISHGTRTKCRKTRAMLGDFSIADCLALRQLRHFYGTRCSFAKIAIPYTIYPSLNLLNSLELCVRINYAMTRKKYIFSLL